MRYNILIILLIFTIASPILSQNIKTLDYPAYTISIPSAWEAYRGDSTIKERTRDTYQIKSVSWNSPIKNISDIPKTIMLSINSYTRTDKKEITISEVKNTIMLLNDVSFNNIIEDIKTSEIQENMVFHKKSKEMDGSYAHYYKTYSIYKKDKNIYFTEISTREELYKKEDTKSLIKNIQKSFKIKNDELINR